MFIYVSSFVKWGQFYLPHRSAVSENIPSYTPQQCQLPTKTADGNTPVPKGSGLGQEVWAGAAWFRVSSGLPVSCVDGNHS